MLATTFPLCGKDPSVGQLSHVSLIGKAGNPNRYIACLRYIADVVAHTSLMVVTFF